MSKAIMKFTRSINRRKAIGGGLAAVFGAVAGVSLGQKAAVAALPAQRPWRRVGGKSDGSGNAGEPHATWPSLDGS